MKCVYVCSDGLIKAVGPADIIESQFKGTKFDQVLDVSGMCVLPGVLHLKHKRSSLSFITDNFYFNKCNIIAGLVDAHTHPVWAGDRVHEFAMKVFYSHLILSNVNALVHFIL